MTARFYWIASYPKSGNTWLRLLLESLRNEGAPVDFSRRGAFAPMASNREALDYWCEVPSGDLTDDEAMALRPELYAEEAAASAEPLLRKAHDAWEATPAGRPLFPPELTLGSVYLVRDPRDVAVSFAHHSGSTVDEAIAFMSRDDAVLAREGRSGGVQMRQRLRGWSTHVESWLAARPAPLVLRYEDLSADPVAALERVARLLNWRCAPAVLSRAADAVAFDKLRAAERRHGFPEAPAGRTFFRQGVAGGWRRSLTGDQARRIEADHGPMMRRFGYLS